MPFAAHFNADIICFAGEGAADHALCRAVVKTEMMSPSLPVPTLPPQLHNSTFSLWIFRLTAKLL